MIHEIKSLNYIVSGNKEKIINMDIDNVKNWSFVTDENVDDANSDFSEPWNAHRLLKIKENEPSRGNNDIIYALFDFKDIAVRSDFSKNNFNGVFGPKLDSNPIGFCKGVGSNAFGMSDTSKTAAMTMGTNLEDIRNRRLEGYRTALEWQYDLGDGDPATYIYPALSSLGDDVSSYYNYIFGKHSSVSADAFEKVFTPQTNLSGCARNFIYEFFMASQYNDYNTGTFSGNTFASKNAYDGKYSMEMSSSTNLDNGRKYVGLGEVGGHLFLKYYDERDYSTGKLSGYTDDSGTTSYPTKTMDGNVKQTYQKVEVLDSINRFVTRSNHKANLYSIKLNNLGLDNYPSLKPNLDKIKMDIQKNVRMIAEKLAPAHTQLFKVYIES